jgi:hypothetical protein
VAASLARASKKSWGELNSIVQELKCEDPSDYQAMFRMEKESFDYLLIVVRPHIEKEDTILRESVPAKERVNDLKLSCSFLPQVTIVFSYTLP